MCLRLVRLCGYQVRIPGGHSLQTMPGEREIPERAADVPWSPGKSIVSPIQLSEVMGFANVKKGGRSWPQAARHIAANIAKLPELLGRPQY
jgi:hypothetical protein